MSLELLFVGKFGFEYSAMKVFEYSNKLEEIDYMKKKQIFFRFKLNLLYLYQFF